MASAVTRGSVKLIAFAFVLFVTTSLQGAPDTAASSTQPDSPDNVDKSRFNLFNPVPRELLRDLQTDRPDQTEGPFTVDAGHVQAELDLLNYSYDRRQPHGQQVTSQTLQVAPTNLRIGILNNLEADVIAAPFIWLRDFDRVSQQSDERSGF